MASTSNFPWTRYWYRQGDQPTLANDYLIPPSVKADWFSPGQAATLKTLPELAGIPCLILKGDPGTGKTNEIAAEAARLSAIQSAGLAVKWLNLKLRTESLIEKQAFRSDEFIGWTEGRHALALFFDSMDECWRRVPELGPIIIAELEPHLKKTLPPLYLRFGCRAAEWREEIENDLRRAFDETKEGEKVQVWELAPLTEDDVRVAAKTAGLNEGFLDQVKEREVNAFAAHPITLNMLLATAKEGGALGRDRAEIYQKRMHPPMPRYPSGRERATATGEYGAAATGLCFVSGGGRRPVQPLPALWLERAATRGGSGHYCRAGCAGSEDASGGG